MIYTLTLWLCLFSGNCVPVEIEGNVPFARSPDEACFKLAEPIAERANVALAWVSSCIVAQDT